MLELRQLKELLTLAQAKTVSEAAQRLYISQPALSRSLQRLEDELKVELFVHGKNKIELTDTGHLALTYAQQILDLSALMVTSLRRHEAAKSTVSFKTCAPAPLWELTATCSLVYPHLTQMAAVSSDQEQLAAELLAGEIDCAVLTAPLTTDAVQCVPFLTEKLYFALHRSHPLAGSSCLRFADMDGEAFLLRPQIGFWQHVVEQYLPHCKFLWQRDDNAFNTIVRDSNLLSFASDIVLKREGLRPDRICIPIADDAARVTYYAVIRQDNLTKLQALVTTLEHKAQRLKAAQSLKEPLLT